MLVRYQMNAFVIAVGSYVKPLTEFAIQTGEKIGPVTADLGNNNCQVPLRPGLHPQGSEARRHREEAQDGQMLRASKCQMALFDQKQQALCRSDPLS